MTLKKPFKVEVLYKVGENSYNSLLEELNISSEKSTVTRYVTIFCIDSIMPQTSEDNRCHINTYTDSFVAVKTYEEINEEITEYLPWK